MSTVAPSTHAATTATDTPAEALCTPEDFHIEPRSDLGQRCLRILVARPAGAVLARFDGSLPVDHASYLTVQIGPGQHILLRPDFLECINHSCAPNVHFDMERFALVALRPLAAGEELTYFYPSTEWSMVQPFPCACGATECLGTIAGASQLPREVLGRYVFSPFIRRGLAALEG